MNAKNTISIVANGTLEPEIIVEIRNSDAVIAADYAAYWLMSHNIIADIAVGDFDSVTKSQFQEIKKTISVVLPFSPKKDHTDFELAIGEACKQKPKSLKIFGITGTRFDHVLASVGVLERVVKQGIEVEIFDSRHHMILTNDREITVTKSQKYRYFSVIPLSSTAVVSISGCMYPVHKNLFYRTKSMGVSNEIKGKLAKITIHKGIVVVIKSKDG